ncbi:dihydroneopterin aldolase 2-like [Lotus japonicus]|uniref:7,8-dihydroneopterin aldolase n=1 Tax=Lotus japonicus TaxID=34305 RepID=I3SSH4_LOTJA|nr:dihydroneopterin aldolase 2-like [Lotus japonicus]AFK43216.1 unknown [Lotus japonicus]
MACSKSYDLYHGLGLFVIIISPVFAHVPPDVEATNPGRKMILDDRISLEEFMRAVHFLGSRMKGNMVIPPRQTAEMASDKLMLSGLLFFGFHGALAEERKQGQKFLVDIEAWIDLKPPGKSDNMSDSVDDAKIYGVAKEVLEGPPHYLVESVVAITVLTNHPQISVIRVKVAKPHVAIHGQLDYLGIEIVRHRSDLPV